MTWLRKWRQRFVFASSQSKAFPPKITIFSSLLLLFFSKGHCLRLIAWLVQVVAWWRVCCGGRHVTSALLSPILVTRHYELLRWRRLREYQEIFIAKTSKWLSWGPQSCSQGVLEIIGLKSLIVIGTLLSIVSSALGDVIVTWRRMVLFSDKLTGSTVHLVSNPIVIRIRTLRRRKQRSAFQKTFQQNFVFFWFKLASLFSFKHIFIIDR